MNRMKKCIGVVSVCGVMVFVSACSDVGPTTDPYADMDAGVDMSTPVDMPRTQTPVDLGKDTGSIDQGVQLPAPKEVQAIASAEGITLSWLPAFNAVRYEVRINGGPWLNAGLEMTYTHDDAPGGKVVSATTVASDMTERQHVQLSIEDLVTEDGPEQTYEVRAIYYNGASEASEPITARRPFSLESVQWQRQLNDGDSWEDLTEATTITSMDTSASPEGNTHSYQAILTPSYGQSFHSPVDLGARLAAVDVSVGSLHSCALLNSGDVKCWGDNAFGQLGLGHTEQLISEPGQYNLGLVKLPEEMVAISSGVIFTCGLAVSGNLYCWGSLEEQFLISHDDQGNVPIVSSNVKVIPERHSKHFCFVDTDEQVHCFWNNESGQCGYEVSNTRVSFIQPGVVSLNGDRIKSVHISYSSSCAVSVEDTVYCWGGNYWENSIYNTIGDEVGEMPPPEIDILGGNSKNDGLFAGGIRNYCAINDSRNILCWGASNNGLLGNGQNAHQSPPGVYPAVLYDVRVNPIKIAIGGSNVCVLSDTGAVYCWGKGGTGINGNGSTENFGDTIGSRIVSSVDLGGHVKELGLSGVRFACAVVAGDVKCWGDNSNGQLGRSELGNDVVIGDEPGEMPPQPVELW